ncbi:MAG: bifunctional metallophosphatase/5'-nucleotidase [Anaerolineaceae bacterium]|nr:bifunctional metallophosphatase/5'-nucleotidase [Anaerolineaceae bacterium]
MDKQRFKRFTILHSNDMHGDFLAEADHGNGEMIGGLSLLSGYINQVRSQEKNVIYTISGDMVQGSIIDSEYKGISTIEIMNYLSPDVASLGNHELDYGVPHLLFLEKMANFPIINANLYIKKYNKRLMLPYLIKEVDGFDILFIGILTETVLDSLKQDQQIGTFISLEDAAIEVGRICDVYKNDDIDLTILLTHIGLDSDRQLASLLNPDWGVDMMLGGHSHSVMEQPELVNNILIAQAAVGTDQIGRFDITVDDDTNSIVDWKWELVPIRSDKIQADEQMHQFIDGYKRIVDAKYNTLICRFARKLSHPMREVETELGNLISDIFAENAELDVAFIGSGSIRSKELGPVVTLGDLKQAFPYDDSYSRYLVNGAQLRKIFAHIMRKSNRNSEGECFQVNKRVKAVIDENQDKLISLKVNDIEVEDEQTFKIGIQSYHFNNCQKNLNMSEEELRMIARPKVMASSMQAVLDEYLRHHQNILAEVEGRLVYKG